MTYREYLHLTDIAKKSISPDELAARIKSQNISQNIDNFGKKCKIIFAVSRSDTAELIKISGLKNALKLAEHMDLPVRTVQRWAQAGQAPEKTLKMIGYILISEME